VDAGIVQPPDMCRLPAFHINRGGARFCVRPNRYALALFGGGAVAPRILALHECDNPFLGGFGVLLDTLQEAEFMSGTLR
jgi:hypothetical protein